MNQAYSRLSTTHLIGAGPLISAESAASCTGKYGECTCTVCLPCGDTRFPVFTRISLFLSILVPPL